MGALLVIDNAMTQPPWKAALPAPRSHTASPLQHRTGPREATAKRHHQNHITTVYAAGSVSFIERDRDRGGAGVAVHVEIDKRALARHTETLGNRGDDSGVRLMGDDELDVSRGH